MMEIFTSLQMKCTTTSTGFPILSIENALGESFKKVEMFPLEIIKRQVICNPEEQYTGKFFYLPMKAMTISCKASYTSQTFKEVNSPFSLPAMLSSTGTSALL